MMKKNMFNLVLSFVLMLSAGAARAQQGSYTVHEWGTFTTLQGSDGIMLPGLQKEEEALPRFVYSHGGFEPQVTNSKGIPQDCDSVKVKMETPVLYFYAEKQMQISARIGFPRGAVSQWYPQRTAGEDAPAAATRLDFSKPYNGWIRWDATILPKGSDEPYSPPASAETHTWTAPRATDANKVKVGNETEKFLFYRGVGNFPMPVRVRFTSNEELVVENTGQENISYFFVYEKKEGQVGRVLWDGAITKGSSQTVQVSGGSGTEAGFSAKLQDFQKALVAAGLYEKEAAAMLNTWEKSYFDMPGIKVFWIVPRNMTDEILPIELHPAPAAMERVLIGRSEVLSPSFEKQLLEDFKNGMGYKYDSDRYALAYKERVEQLKNNTTTGVEEHSADNVKITAYPNPAGRYLTLTVSGFRSSQKTNILIRDINGREVLKLEGQSISPGGIKRIDISTLAKGSYTVHIGLNGREYVSKFIKE